MLPRLIEPGLFYVGECFLPVKGGIIPAFAIKLGLRKSFVQAFYLLREGK